MECNLAQEFLTQLYSENNMAPGTTERKTPYSNLKGNILGWGIALWYSILPSLYEAEFYLLSHPHLPYILLILQNLDLNLLGMVDPTF